MLIHILISIQIIFVQTFNHQKPVAEKIWSVRCKRNDYVLNDCNWCWCGPNHHFQCKARVCEEVDVFGHFKDTIQEIDVGMEGHGAWRSRPTSCTPGVQYQRGTVLCVCDDDGNWPNPVCRDLFRILHAVEVTEKVEESSSQICSPSKLYLVGCNTCFCPSTGKFDANFCTNRTCSDGDPVLEPKYDEELKVNKGEDVNDELKEVQKERNDDEEDNDGNGEFIDIKELIDEVESSDPIQPEAVIRTRKELEVYAACNTQKTYTIGSQKCECLSNNRLICKEYDEIITHGTIAEPYLRSKHSNHSVCSKNSGKVIKFQCNLCVCVNKGNIYCTLRKCLQRDKNHKMIKKVPKLESAAQAPIDELDCTPNTYFNRDCNTCYCYNEGNEKLFACTRRACHPKKDIANLINNCVTNTTYDTDCKRCSCKVIDGEKFEICGMSPQCQTKKLRVIQIESLDSLNGACKPRAMYRHNCNTCKCMPNGRIIRCSSKMCVARSGEPRPIEVEVVPLQQALRETCPKGHSYKVECNLCVCLSNGNALCTTKDCSKKSD